MKMQLIKSTVPILVFTLLFVHTLGAENLPSHGIGLRGIHWDITRNDYQIHVHTNMHTADVNVDGFGGSIFFFSRVSKQLLLDFSIGGIGIVETEQTFWQGENVNASGVTPIVFGLHYMLLPAENKGFLQPYIETGIGVYLVSDVRVEERYFGDQSVAVGTDTRPGGYIGSGINFVLTRNFALNYNMRYHLVDFQDNTYQNGFEFGFGFSVMWGSFDNN